MKENTGLSSLSLSLILLALVAVVGVLAYNALTSRRRQAALRERSNAASAAVPQGADAATSARLEPSLVRAAFQGQTEDAARTPTPAGASGAVEPTLGERASETGSGAPRLNPFTDCIVEFELHGPTAAERLLPLVSRFRRVGGKPVLVEAATTLAPARPVGDVSEPSAAGQATGDAASRDTTHADGAQTESDWAPLAARQRFQRLRVGVLLANRHGPLNAMEYSEFVSGVQAIAEQLSLLGDTPDMDAILRRARALDESCAALDAQIGLNIQSPEALGIDDLARLARETGCTERGNNRYARLGPHGEVLFSLALGDSPDRLSLLLDVPRAPLAAQPWEQMLACARVCTEQLGGRLVDDQGRLLAETSLLRIGEQLAERQQALVQAGLSPGSPVALRIFN